MRLAVCLASLACVAGCLPQTAFAASAAVKGTCAGKSGCVYAVVYRAAPGETNDVTVTGTTDALVIHDRGATITAGRDCQTAGPNEVHCYAHKDCEQCHVEPLYYFNAELADQADRFHGEAYTSYQLPAGTGDDLVEISSGSANGDGGRDVLRGTQYGVVLADGDDGSKERPFDTDELSAAAGGMADYSARSSAVQVDLERGVGGGPDADRLIGMTEAAGGAGDDKLVGTDGPNGLLGKLGNDDLRGKGGADQLAGGSGTDFVSGGEGDDYLAPAGSDVGDRVPPGSGGNDGRRDTVDCGDGTDTVDESLNDRINPGCERVWLFDLSVDAFRMSLPLSTPRSPMFSIRYDCPQRGARLTLVVRTAAKLRGVARGTALGHRTTRCHSGNGWRWTPLRLSAEGRRALRRHGSVVVRITATERNPALLGRERFWVASGSVFTTLRAAM